MKAHIFRRSILDGFSFALLVAVLLAVVFEPTEEQMLNLTLISNIFLASMVAGAGLSHILNMMGFKTFGEYLFEPDYVKAQQESKAWYVSFWGWHMFVTILILFVVGVVKTNFDIYELLDQDGFEGAKRLFAGIFSPNWAVLPVAVLNIS